jgi:hypothetical protein
VGVHLFQRLLISKAVRNTLAFGVFRTLLQAEIAEFAFAMIPKTSILLNDCDKS